MSAYSAQVARERGETAKSEVSVGDTIDVSQVYSSSHPLYISYSAQLRENLAAIIARESEKQNSAQQAVCTVAVAHEVRDDISREYPEFRVVWPQWGTPVHSAWVARRQVVNQYMVHHLRRFADSYVHYGGSALGYLTQGCHSASLMVDVTSAVAVHDSFGDDVACARLVATSALAASNLGWVVEPGALTAYARGESLMKVKDRGGGSRQGDALVVDGSLVSIGPLQFAAAMMQHGASVGMFALPYHSTMLVHGDGQLPGTDVHYSLGENDVRFRYPQGVAGVTRYTASNWHQWLLNTVRKISGVSDHRAYQFELMGTRGCFMLVRVVQVEVAACVENTFVHSLQLEGMQDKTLVQTWRLRDLASDVADPRSWERVIITVPTRVVEKVHDYAMALPVESFSRHALRKRLAVVNDRVVVQGTSVEVHDALTSSDLDTLEIALFVHCFVARYESGRLSAAMRAVVDEVAGFGSMSVLRRMAAIVSACSTLVYDWSIGAVDEALRGALDRARRWLGGLPAERSTLFEPAPQFIRYETIANKRGGAVLRALREVVRTVVKVQDLQPSMPGFGVLAALEAHEVSDSVDIPVMGTDFEVRSNGLDVFSDVVDTSVRGAETAASNQVQGMMRELNEFDQDSGTRHMMAETTLTTDVLATDIARDDYSYDPGYPFTLDDFHESVIPGMRAVDFKYDPSSISVDDQDRSLAAEFLDLPLDFGEVPKAMQVYESVLRAYNVTKRPMTLQETLSAFHARNLSAPVLALPQNESMLIQQVWNDFLDTACVPEARQMLVQFAKDPVSLEETALRDWSSKVRPETVLKVVKYLFENPDAWEQFRVGRYESMIKVDVKPPLSDKPLRERIEPQMIVHHLPAINAVFSSVLRVLVRRLISMLKPNFMLNLLKDMPQVRDVMQNFHDWSSDVVYLENDFSKYDKSQGQFVHALEGFVLRALGMNEAMLKSWGLGHVECDIRSVAVGLSLHVRYQRKSGDASTAFGNGMLNMISVMHAYKGTDVVWAVFMGDDSLVCARKVACGETAVQALAEKFNLQAKFFITQFPYFASNMVLINQDERRIVCVPDPVKRVEKWSMAVSARDPKWDERYLSALNSLGVYKQRSNLVGLAQALYARYGSHDGFELGEVGDAIASAIRTKEDFRALWAAEPTVVDF